ncbi:unnamed protein product [Echinostoma caproni]|uniref:UAS domain-containing protein n=1 Tax=Echinostoma caproni TaxID=27848 RepID=A0A183AWV8_9TREM|nr:unnamed protein product [Echinostoma caproni]
MHMFVFSNIDIHNGRTYPSTCMDLSSDGSPRLRRTSGHIELRIHVYNCGPSPGVECGPTTTTHALRLQPSWRVNQLRSDVSSLTDIPSSRQLWSENPPMPTNVGNVPTSLDSSGASTLTKSDALLCLVSELNSRPHLRVSPSSSSGRSSRGSSPHNPSLADLGLQPGEVYTLYVTRSPANGASTDNPSLRIGSNDQPYRSYTESTTGANAATTSSKRTSYRKPMHCKLSDDHPSDIDDDVEDYDYDNYIEDLDEVEQPKYNLWADPLIPESHFSDDPSEATEKFCQLFLQRYCGDGATMAPPFATCSLDVALSSSVGIASVTDRKPLFIYLHHNDSVACHVFCQQILCSPGLGQFLGDHGFCLWPWDVTRPRARERLLGWLENKIPKLASFITPLAVSCFSFF